MYQHDCSDIQHSTRPCLNQDIGCLMGLYATWRDVSDRSNWRGGHAERLDTFQPSRHKVRPRSTAQRDNYCCNPCDRKGQALTLIQSRRTVPATDWLADCGDAEITAQDVDATTQAIGAMTEGLTAAGAIPLALGGDHYNSFPACLGYSRGLGKRAPNARFGYIQIDGHLDFSDRLGAWGSHNHATNARRISELPNIDVSNMVWVGIAGWVDGGDLALIEEQGGQVFSASDVHKLGAAEVMRQALAACHAGVRRALSVD